MDLSALDGIASSLSTIGGSFDCMNEECDENLDEAFYDPESGTAWYKCKHGHKSEFSL